MDDAIIDFLFREIKNIKEQNKRIEEAQKLENNSLRKMIANLQRNSWPTAPKPTNERLNKYGWPRG